MEEVSWSDYVELYKSGGHLTVNHGSTVRIVCF
jgi:hypothetical protein